MCRIVRSHETDHNNFQAYDSHCNLVLGDVEETIYVAEDEEDENTVKASLIPLSQDFG